jgi:hypothetical protein
VSGSPEELLRSALEKIVFFECRVASLEHELEAARGIAARARAEADAARRREGELDAVLAQSRREQAFASANAAELAERVRLLEAERERFLSGMVERARVAGAPAEEGGDAGDESDLAGFIAELRAEIESLRAWKRAAEAGGVRVEDPSRTVMPPSVRPERSEAESKGETVAPLPAGGPAFWSAAERQAAEGEALLARGDAQGARQKLEPLVAPVMLEEREAPPRLAARVLAAMGYVNAALGRPERGGPMLRMALERDPSNEAARRAVAALDAKAPLPPFAAPAASASH